MLEEAGEGAHVAQVEAGVAAGQAAEVAGLVRLGRGHVVVDPHPPARVEARHADRQLPQQLQVARSVATGGFSITALALIVYIPCDVERVCVDPLYTAQQAGDFIIYYFFQVL